MPCGTVHVLERYLAPFGWVPEAGADGVQVCEDFGEGLEDSAFRSLAYVNIN